MGWFFNDESDASKSMRCFNEHLRNVCGGCEKLDPNNEYYTGSGLFGGHYEYMCCEKGVRTKWDDNKCWNYSAVSPSKVDCVERYYTFTRRRYYYILTAICNVLGIKQGDGLFQNFKTLIQIVRSDINTLDKAINYDIYGPMIADKIELDHNRVELCKDLLANYLSKAFVAIADNRLEDAISIYEEMVNFLYVRYTRKDNLENIIDVDVIAKPKILVK